MKTLLITKTSRFAGYAYLLLGIVALSLACPSCSTTRGFGRDVKKVGNKIEHAANRVEYN